MKLVTGAELAAILGISKQAVSKATIHGHIERIQGKYDLHSQQIIEYINLKSPYRPARKAKSPPELEQAANLSEDDAEESVAEPKEISESMVDLNRSDLERQKLIEQVLAMRVRTQQQRNELIDRAFVKRTWAKLYSIDTSELHPLGEKIASDIAAICKVENSETIFKIKSIIDTHVFRALQHAKRLMDETLKKMGEEEIGRQ